jgi:protein-tyrosine-phosphatase
MLRARVLLDGGSGMTSVKTILYVCVHNAGRSQMAEAFTNRLAKERGLPVRALSAGTMAATGINPAAKKVMEEAGVPMTGQRPKLLTRELANSADRIITMGCGVDAAACPAGMYISEDWGLDDPSGQPIETVRRIRDQIRKRVEAALTLFLMLVIISVATDKRTNRATPGAAIGMTVGLCELFGGPLTVRSKHKARSLGPAPFG